MLKQIQLYATIAIVALAFIGGWVIKGWYEDSKEKDVLETNITVFNAQTLKDQDELLAAQIKLDKYEDEVDKLKGEAYEINKGICSSSDSHAKFNILLNKTIREANKSIAAQVSN